MKLRELANALQCEVRGDGEIEIVDVAPVEDAPPGTLTLVIDRRYAPLLATTRAAAVLLPPDAPDVPLPSLRAREPYLAFAAALDLFHPLVRPRPGVHPTAVIASSAELGADAFVGARVVVGEGVVVGRDAVLHPGVVIYPDVRIGDVFTAHAGAIVREGVRIGDRVTLHAGAVIGSDGFGFVALPTGHRKIPQVGSVVLEDDVEVGANATIDRATMGSTRVGSGTKIDNLVMVGHGSRIGPGCLLAGQVGLAGSTVLGAGVMMGGQAGAGGHLTIGDGARIAAQTGVHGDLRGGAAYGGSPAIEAGRWRRVVTSLPRLPGLFRRLRRVERALGLTGAESERGDA